MSLLRRRRTTPADLLRSLPEPTVTLPHGAGSPDTLADDLRRAELRHSVLTIAELTHPTETALVRAVAAAARGRTPGAGGAT